MLPLRFARCGVCTRVPLKAYERCALSYSGFASGPDGSLKNKQTVSLSQKAASLHANVGVNLTPSLSLWEKSLWKVTPASVTPYVKLIRLDKPIGTLLLLWPCCWSIGLATESGSLPDSYTLFLFSTGAFLMRSAGVIINDMWDKDFDKKVERTKNRPLASGQIKTKDALFLLGGQLGLGLLILLQFDFNSIILGASSLGLVVTYPLMKRLTHWPQLILGMVFNWGALLGWSVVRGGEVCLPVVLPLYAAGIMWTLIYDTIYALQDRKDDIMVGVKSTAVMFGENTQTWLSGFSVAMISSLVLAGVNSEQTWPFYGSLLVTSTLWAKQILTLKINDSSDCAKKFNDNRKIGLVIFLGIVGSTLLKAKESETKDKDSKDKIYEAEFKENSKKYLDGLN